MCLLLTAYSWIMLSHSSCQRLLLTRVFDPFTVSVVAADSRVYACRPAACRPSVSYLFLFFLHRHSAAAVKRLLSSVYLVDIFIPLFCFYYIFSVVFCSDCPCISMCFRFILNLSDI